MKKKKSHKMRIGMETKKKKRREREYLDSLRTFKCSIRHSNILQDIQISLKMFKPSMGSSKVPQAFKCHF